MCWESLVFSDSFVNIIELLDDLFQRAADAEEPEDQNFIRKHTASLRRQGSRTQLLGCFQPCWGFWFDGQ